MLEGLDAVNWAALGHAYGSAEDVPFLVRQVRSADPKVFEDALHELCFTIVHQGTRYSATAPAVPFLVELAIAPDTQNRARLVNLLAYAAVGDDEASLPDGILTLDQLRHTLVRPGPGARARVAEALLATLDDRSGWQAESLLWDLMVVAFEGDPQAPRPPFAGLNPFQQRIVAALSRMPWIWQAAPGEGIPADNPLWAYGLPNTQQGLLAYLSDMRSR